MSTTVTETQQRSVPQHPASKASSAETLLKKRENFTRSTSIEKLKKFNNFICTQHYYVIPSLLLWLKTSQSVLTSHVEKCIIFVKTMIVIRTVRECIQNKVKTIDNGSKHKSFAAFFRLTARDLLPVVNMLLLRIQQGVAEMYEDAKRLTLVAAIYGGILLIIFQMIGCALLLTTKIPTWGFLFLVGCVLLMAKIAVNVMFQNVAKAEKQKLANVDPKTVEERRRIRKQLSVIGKTISNVKLF